MISLSACVMAYGRQHAAGAKKIPEDLRRYAALIDRVHPRAIVETGTDSGMSALWFADTARCPVVTIDVAPQVPDVVASAWGERVECIVGDSVDPEVVAGVWERTVGRDPVLVVLDSDHSTDHVATELAAYSPMISVGSYLVVEDTIIAWMPEDAYVRRLFGDGPLGAVESFLATHDNWEIDREIEDLYPATQHPGGFLRRLR